MQKEVAKGLKDKAEEVAKIFSNPERYKNQRNEVFTLTEIIPLSENTASVIYTKDTDKRVCFFFFYVDALNPFWWYFAPTDSHIIGMEAFGRIKTDIERSNYQYNFAGVKK